LTEPEGVPSFLSVPLWLPETGDDPSEMLGVINMTRKFGGAFTEDDLKLLDAVAGHAAAQIHKSRLIERDREHQRLEHELRIASEIQLSLLPNRPLLTGPVHAAGVCTPAKRVGGDFFDYWLHGHRICMIVADVSGHDLGAALMATAVRSVVRSESTHRGSIAQLATQINRFMSLDLTRSERLITLCYLELEVNSGRLTYCSCGHPPPLLLRSREPVWLKAGGPMLGIAEDMTFDEGEARMADGDLLVVYTDGVADAGMPDAVEFGLDGLARSVDRARDLPPRHLADKVIDAVRRHVSSSELEDDATVLAVRYGTVRSE
jgi:serine phosphatase RsbU (regulator of sigma subunit)